MLGTSIDSMFSGNDPDLIVAASAMLDSAQAPLKATQSHFLPSDNMITFTPSGTGAPARLDRKSPFPSEPTPQPSPTPLVDSVPYDSNVISSSARPPRPSAIHGNGQDGPSSPSVVRRTQIHLQSPKSTVRPRKLCIVYIFQIFQSLAILYLPNVLTPLILM